MPSKAPAKNSISLSQPKRSSAGKGQTLEITSQRIATDLAAFRKQGGTIELLGNTPLRPAATAFSSKGATQPKTAAAPTAKAAARG
jgi:hypothetical protein